MSKSILIIEDDEDIVELMKHYLEKENFALKRASDGFSGRKRAQAENSDMIILHIVLPKIDPVRRQVIASMGRFSFHPCKGMRSCRSVAACEIEAGDGAEALAICLMLGVDKGKLRGQLKRSFRLDDSRSPFQVLCGQPELPCSLESLGYEAVLAPHDQRPDVLPTPFVT